jgi:P-type Cu+ transporter
MFADTQRAGARHAIEALRRSGADITMLTGDGAEVARDVAEALGIERDEVHAEQQPEAKSARIVAAQAAGHTFFDGQDAPHKLGSPAPNRLTPVVN